MVELPVHPPVQRGLAHVRRFLRDFLLAEIECLATLEGFRELIERRSADWPLPDYSWLSVAAALAHAGRRSQAYDTVVAKVPEVGPRKEHALRYLGQRRSS